MVHIRQKLLADDLHQEVKHRPQTWQDGLFPRPDYLARTRPLEVEYFIDGARTDEHMFRWAPDEDIFGDGSCLYPTDPYLATGGFAMGQWAADGRNRYCIGALPTWAPQTAGWAEQVWAILATSMGKGEHTIVTDCAAVVTAAANPPSILHGKVAHAGAWMSCPSRPRAVRKTKAHRTLAAAEALGDQADWERNDKVDKLAKLAAADALPPADLVKLWQQEQALQARYLSYVGEVMTEWSQHQAALLAKVKEERGPAVPPPPAPFQAPARHD